jgi:1-hydroxycarotenoid 3,4-desaturase
MCFREQSLRQRHVIIVGAGVGGLMAALILAGRGVKVTVLERAATPGGKMRQMFDGDAAIDAGPTVFTLKKIFQEAFASVALDFDACAPSTRANVLARHAWDGDTQFDLFADIPRSIEAVGNFAGAAEAEGFVRFCEDSQRVWRSLERSFVRAPAPSFMGMLKGAGLRGLPDLLAVSPFQTLWDQLDSYFKDPRLRQLFGRYSTYCGSSPYLAPATLMLVAHVEQDGVWMIEGGMHRLAQVIAEQGQIKGAEFRYGVHVDSMTRAYDRSIVRLADGEIIEADAIIFNGDSSALAQGLLGLDMKNAAPPVTPNQRSLSAITWTLSTRTRGFPLVRHNVFFSSNYKSEFDALESGRLIDDPTIYVCAQDRGDEYAPRDAPERLLALVNAPAIGDARELNSQEIAACTRKAMALLGQCGLHMDTAPSLLQTTSPNCFNNLFPGTGGALYGRASHGWRASFQRPGVRTKMPGLYLAGGSVHPGPGVPMAALSGWAAATCALTDLTSR